MFLILWWCSLKCHYADSFVDFVNAGLILNEINAGEPQWLRGPIGRPLEPDAGNAAEGSEGPMPDWRFSHAIFRAWLFCL